MSSKAPEERFWYRVNKTETCWLWLGKTNQGYGRVTAKGKYVGAHRFAYELLVGQIPKDMVIDHLCRVRICVNPAHLRTVTNIQNVMCGFSLIAIRARMNECCKGHPYTEENLHIYKGKRGIRRICRTCSRVGLRARRAKKREKNQ